MKILEKNVTKSTQGAVFFSTYCWALALIQRRIGSNYSQWRCINSPFMPRKYTLYLQIRDRKRISNSSRGSLCRIEGLWVRGPYHDLQLNPSPEKKPLKSPAQMTLFKPIVPPWMRQKANQDMTFVKEMSDWMLSTTCSGKCKLITMRGSLLPSLQTQMCPRGAALLASLSNRERQAKVLPVWLGT